VIGVAEPKSLKSLNLTNFHPNKKKNNNNNKVKSKPLELYELAGKKSLIKKHLIYHWMY
jgi:hypothetical protein